MINVYIILTEGHCVVFLVDSTDIERLENVADVFGTLKNLKSRTSNISFRYRTSAYPNALQQARSQFLIVDVEGHLE
jgi:hypothetical protein